MIKSSTCFNGRLLIIASYSYKVTNYCESKSDIYSLPIRINLFKYEEHIIVCFTLLVENFVAIMINKTLEHKYHNVFIISSFTLISTCKACIKSLNSITRPTGVSFNCSVSQSVRLSV